MMVNIPLRHKFQLKQIVRERNLLFPGQVINLLDIGASNGSFMTLASQNMEKLNQVNGVEIDARHSKLVCKTGRLFIQDLQKGPGDIPIHAYEIITIWETLEHVENVYTFLRNVKQLLTANGFIAITTPNLLSFSRMIKGSHWIGIRDKSHKILYDQKSLRMVLENCGFTVKKMCNYFLPNRLPNSLDWINALTSNIPGGGMIFAIAISTDKEI